MTEEFISFLWRYKFYFPDKLNLDGEKIEVIHPGELNRDSGPDFFNSKIKIGNTIWAGNVEVHQRASDWYLHGHDKNAAYDNVVLHITAENNQPVYTSKGRQVATVILDYDTAHLRNYDALITSKKWIPCADSLPGIDQFIISSFLTKAGTERLEFRTRQILANLENTINDWDEAFYRQLARSYGFHVNSQPFEALARSIPYIIVKKHSHTLEQMEAIFFGQAGFLHDDYSEDDYYNHLKKEYDFLKAKYSLQPVETHLWKFMRLRPGNFPTVRIAQFVSLLKNSSSFLSAILDAENLKSLYNIFSTNVSDYWQKHYTFGNPSRTIEKTLGKESIKVIIINTVAPFYFVYGKKMGMVQYQDKAISILEEIGPEVNSVIKGWKQYGIKPANAFEFQALLHLKAEYCDRKKCISCAIGARFISNGL